MLHALQRRTKRVGSRSSRRHHLSYDGFLYGLSMPVPLRMVLREGYRRAVNHIVDLLEPSSPVCRGVHLNRNDSRASERWSRRKSREKEKERERDIKGEYRNWRGYPTSIVTRGTTVPFISRNIISQSYWPIRTSCLYERHRLFSHSCVRRRYFAPFTLRLPSPLQCAGWTNLLFAAFSFKISPLLFPPTCCFCAYKVFTYSC